MGRPVERHQAKCALRRRRPEHSGTRRTVGRPGTADLRLEARRPRGLGTQSVRRGGGLRIYLEPPWFSSGEGELLGVVLRPDEVTEPRDDRMTRWGMDPIWGRRDADQVAKPCRRAESGIDCPRVAAGTWRSPGGRRRLPRRLGRRETALVERHRPGCAQDAHAVRPAGAGQVAAPLVARSRTVTAGSGRARPARTRPRADDPAVQPRPTFRGGAGSLQAATAADGHPPAAPRAWTVHPHHV